MKANLRMWMLLIAIALGARAGLAQSASGPARDWWGTRFVRKEPASFFVAKEASLDVFGTYIAPEQKFSHLFQTSIRDGTWGGGLGLNYFFTRYFGIGGDVNFPDNGGNFVDSVAGNVVLRLPIEKIRLAPYGFGGAGRTTDTVWQWIGQAGVGLEYRFDANTGVFVDGRYVWADKGSDGVLFRAGLRLVF